MADSGGRTDPFSDFISLVAGPIAAVIRSFDQLRRGADELMKGFENFNRTMTNLNDTAERVNVLLGEIEEPVRAVLPQVVRTVRFADDLASRMSGPIEQVLPGLVRLSETLSSPVIASLPTDLGTFVDSLNELVKRLSPLGQIAESAGGLFGLRIPGVSRATSDPASDGGAAAAAVEPEPTPATKPTSRTTTVRTIAVSKSGKKTTSRKTATRKKSAS